MPHAPWGNQHASRKARLLGALDWASHLISIGDVEDAREVIAAWRVAYALVPASTRRRWRCGR